MGPLANYAIYIVTTIVTIVTFVGFLASDSLKIWVKTHSAWVFYALIFLFIVAGALLNYLIEEKRRNRELREAAAKPSDHDRKLFQMLTTALPSDGAVIEWLKENFIANRFLGKDFNVIQSTLRSMRLRSLEFDDAELEASYDQLHASLQGFEDAALESLWIDSSGQWLSIPQEWEDGRFSKAVDEINEARLDLVEKYDNLLEVAHKKGIDQ